jgi:hypothetical protein
MQTGTLLRYDCSLHQASGVFVDQAKELLLLLLHIQAALSYSRIRRDAVRLIIYLNMLGAISDDMRLELV